VCLVDTIPTMNVSGSVLMEVFVRETKKTKISKLSGCNVEILNMFLIFLFLSMEWVYL